MWEFAGIIAFMIFIVVITTLASRPNSNEKPKRKYVRKADKYPKDAVYN